MGLLDKLWSALRTDPSLAELSDEQSRAVVEALVAIVFSDNELASEEVAQFDRQLERLTWRWAHSEREREKVLAEARTRCELLEDPESAVAFVASIAERLPQPEVREKVFGMCAALALADRSVLAEERNLLGGLRQAFGISEERAVAIEAEARVKLGL